MLKTNKITNFLVYIIYLFSFPIVAQVGIGTLSPTAQLTVNEDATFNESGGANDFRIETTNSENMFFIDGTNDRIGINNSTPLYRFHFKSFPENNWQFYFENNNTTLAAVALTQNTNANNGNRVLMGMTNYIGSSFEATGVIGLSSNTTSTGRGGIGVMGAANNERGNAIEAALYFSGNYWGWGGYFNADLYCAGTFYGSDRRLKRDIEPITDALNAINNLEPVSYFYDTERYPGIGLDENRKSFGFIAQELENIFPEMVKEKLLVLNSNRERKADVNSERQTDLFKVVNYTLLVPILTQAIKEQQTIIEEQDSKIETLENRLDALENRLQTIIENRD